MYAIHSTIWLTRAVTIQKFCLGGGGGGGGGGV